MLLVLAQVKEPFCEFRSSRQVSPFNLESVSLSQTGK